MRKKKKDVNPAIIRDNPLAFEPLFDESSLLIKIYHSPATPIIISIVALLFTGLTYLNDREQTEINKGSLETQKFSLEVAEKGVQVEEKTYQRDTLKNKIEKTKELLSNCPENEAPIRPLGAGYLFKSLTILIVEHFYLVL